MPMLSAAALFLTTSFQSFHLQNKGDSSSLNCYCYVECEQEGKKMVKVRSSVRKKNPNTQGIKAIMNQRISPFSAFRGYNETLMTGHAKILDLLDSGSDP